MNGPTQSTPGLSVALLFRSLAFSLFLLFELYPSLLIAESSEPPALYSLAETVEARGLQMKVSQLNALGRVGPSKHYEFPQAGALFLAIALQFTNISEMAVPPRDIPIILGIRDDKERLYVSNLGATFALAMERELQTDFMTSLAPGATTVVVNVFEVPQAVLDAEQWAIELQAQERITMAHPNHAFFQSATKAAVEEAIPMERIETIDVQPQQPHAPSSLEKKNLPNHRKESGAVEVPLAQASTHPHDPPSPVTTPAANVEDRLTALEQAPRPVESKRHTEVKRPRPTPILPVRQKPSPVPEEQSAEQSTTTYVVKAPTAEIYRLPGARDEEPLHSLKTGDTLEVTFAEGPWYGVMSPVGGWVRASSIERAQ